MPYCDRCDQQFYSERSLNKHMQESTSHNICCGRDFPTFSRLEAHWVQSPTHHYCQPCGRSFQNENNLRNHRKSSVHSTRDVRCPFGCGMSFIENSHLVLHLEGGACSSGMNRNTVNKFVRQYDRSNVITDPSRLLTAGPSGEEVVNYIASRASWNGNGFECYLCHNVFPYLNRLNQHLASPAHQDKFYICRGPNCASRFSTLSALCQHIESEKCGVRRFREVRDAMDNLFGSMRRLTL